jgi:hypothetical protein
VKSLLDLILDDLKDPMKQIRTQEMTLKHLKMELHQVHIPPKKVTRIKLGRNTQREDTHKDKTTWLACETRLARR